MSVTLQELFDSQAGFRPADVGLLLDFNHLWEKHKNETSEAEFSAKYYEDLSAIADKYDLDYSMPKHLGKLTAVEGVGSTTTIH